MTDDSSAVAAHAAAQSHHYLVHYPAHPPRAKDPHYADFNAYKERRRHDGTWTCDFAVEHRGGDTGECDLDRPLECHHRFIEFAVQNSVDLALLEKDYPGVSSMEVGAWVESAANLMLLCVFHHRGHAGVHTASAADFASAAYIRGLISLLPPCRSDPPRREPGYPSYGRSSQPPSAPGTATVPPVLQGPVTGSAGIFTRRAGSSHSRNRRIRLFLICMTSRYIPAAPDPGSPGLPRNRHGLLLHLRHPGRRPRRHRHVRRVPRCLAALRTRRRRPRMPRAAAPAVRSTPRMHDYQRSPHSGAGNCDCGHAAASRVHPHVYTQMMGSELCVCAYPAGNPVHIDAAAARPRPVRSLEDVIRGARGGDAPAQAQGYA